MKKRRALFIVLVITLLIGIIPVQAVELDYDDPEPVIDEYIYLYQMTSTLSINSSGLATCGGSAATSNINSNYSITISVCLYRQTTSGSWASVKTWYASNINSVALTRSYYVTSGYYKVVTTARVYNASGIQIESAKLTSNISHY